MKPSLASPTPASASYSISGTLYGVYSYISAGMGAVYEGIVDRVEETAWKSGYPGMGRQAVSVFWGAVSMLLFTLAFSRVWNRFMAGGRATQPQQHHEPGNLKRQEELLRSRNEANERATVLARKIEDQELEWERAQDASSRLLNEATERVAGLEEQIGVLERKRQEAQEELSRSPDEANEKVAELEKEIEDLKRERQEAQEASSRSLNEANKNLEKLGQRISSLTGQLSKVSKERDEAIKETKEGEKEIIFPKEENERLVQENTRLKGEWEEAQKEWDDIREQIMAEKDRGEGKGKEELGQRVSSLAEQLSTVSRERDEADKKRKEGVEEILLLQEKNKRLEELLGERQQEWDEENKRTTRIVKKEGEGERATEDSSQTETNTY